MYNQRRSSAPEVHGASQPRRRSGGFGGEGTTVQPVKKRRASCGFMNSEVMEVSTRRHEVRSASLGHVTADLRHPGLDAIRFASYRTAAKLRYVQKRTNMHLVDIWNIIEAFRENGLNTLDPYTDVKVSRLETLISTLYHSLNKRLSAENRINVAASTAILLNWLLGAYDRTGTGQVQVFSIKVALVTLCNSKPLDKLRYIFSQISDSNGHLGLSRFSEYLREVLTLPSAVYETPSFPYSEHLASSIFDGVWRINVNDFLDVLLSEPGPDCLTWLPLIHRLAQSEADNDWSHNYVDDEFKESLMHTTGCDGCRRDQFSGLRYKCDTCSNYNLCQDCFWLGRISQPHQLEHPVKEYITPHPNRPLSMSMRRSLRCIPSASNFETPRFPETPEPTLDLAHIVPSITHGTASEDGNQGPNSCDSWSSNRSFSGSNSHPDWSTLDEEHRLIAHYANCLAIQHATNTNTPGDASDSSISPSCLDSFKAQKNLIQELEVKNREITKEINRIKEQTSSGSNNPVLASELRTLRDHRTTLETQLTGLQDSRKHLMQQLEVLMNRLKSQAAAANKTSPNTSLPNSSSANVKTSPNSNTINCTIPNSTMSSQFTPYSNNLSTPMTTFGSNKNSQMNSGVGMVNASGLPPLGGFGGGQMGFSTYGMGGSQTGLSSIGMNSGSTIGLSTLGFGGSSTGLSTIGLGSSGLSGSNLGLTNLGLASLAGFGKIGGSSTGLSSMGLTRANSFGGSRDQIMTVGGSMRNQRPMDPFSRDVPGYPQRGDGGPNYPRGPPPPPPPRDLSSSGTITAAPPAMSYSAPVTPSHSTSGVYGSSQNMSDIKGEDDGRGPLPSGTDSEESEGEQIRSDLLIAADSVTAAMSSLVRELNSESSDEEKNKRKSSSGKRASKGEELVWPVLASSKDRGSLGRGMSRDAMNGFENKSRNTKSGLLQNGR